MQTLAKSEELKKLEPLSKAELTLLILLAIVQFTNIVDFMIMMPLGPFLMRLFDITPGQFGNLVSAYNFAAGFTGFFSAFVMDRFDRKKSLLFCYFGFTVGTLACALAPSYFWLMAARSLAGAFGGVLGAIVFSIVGDAFVESKRGRAMGTIMTSFSMASVLGVPFGLFLASQFSWHTPFVFVALVAAVTFVFLFLRLPSMSKHLENGIKPLNPLPLLRDLAGQDNLRWALLFTLVLSLGHFIIIPFLSPSMVANVGFKESDLPLIYFFGGSLTFFSAPLVGRLADRIGKPKVFITFSFVSFLPILLITQMGPASLLYALLVTSFFFVAINGRMVPSMAMVASAVKPSERGAFMSINSSVQAAGSGSAALLAGLIVERSSSGRLESFSTLGYLSMGLVLIGVLISPKLKL